MEALDLAAMMSDVVELYEPVAEEAGHLLTAGAMEPVEVHGDRQLLGQAAANLIDNALKYAIVPGQARVVEITVRVEVRDRHAAFIVTDDGPGIPEKERERVLKRFVRLEESRSLPGSGLGLSLVSAVARLHGGTFHLEDNTPGLRAVVLLPLSRSASAA